MHNEGLWKFLQLCVYEGKEESDVEDFIIITWMLNTTVPPWTVFTVGKSAIKAAYKSQRCNSSHSLAGL